MPDPADQIRANAEMLCTLYSRMRESVTHRSRSSVGRADWEAACAAFHDHFDELYFPGGDAGWRAFIAGTDEGIEAALLFLEVDQFTFRSGYHKQIVWDWLKKAGLTQAQYQRLEEVAVGYLYHRARREFWHMANFMRRHAAAPFWSRVESIAEHEPGDTARKARWLLLVRKNLPVRRWISNELLRSRYQSGYVPRLDF